MEREASKKAFVSGVSVLTLSAILVKVIGLVYKIPLLHILGAEGMGFFNAAYEIYTLFFVISTAGLPVAVSVLISESAAAGRMKNVTRIHTISFSVFTAIGIFGTLFMAFGARLFSDLVGNEGAGLAVLAISPTVLFVCASGALRGFFQGCGDMVPTAVSQIIEAVGKLVLGLVFALFAVRRGYRAETCAAFAVLGVTIGCLLSALYLLILGRVARLRCRTDRVDLSTERRGVILRQLLALAVPVTLSSSLAGVSRVVDMTLLLRRLQSIGFSSDAAMAMFGSYSTLAVPIYHLPASLVAGISVALVPALAAATEEKNGKKASDLIASSLRLCALCSLPLAAGITVFARPILQLLFSGEGEAIAVSVMPLSLLGLSVFSSCLAAVTNAVLYAYKRASLPIVSMLAGTAVKIVSAYILIGIPDIGLLGAPLSTLLCNLVSVGMNFHYIDRETDFHDSLLSLFLRPLAAALSSIAAAIIFYAALYRSGAMETASFLSSVCLCGAVYVICAARFGALSEEDIMTFPGGQKLLPVLKKIKILK